MFQIFAHSLKKKKKKNSKTLAYFSIDSRKKLFFPALFFFINKKVHHCYNQQICIYICDSFLILSIFLFPFYVFLVFLSILSSNLINAL